MEETQFPQDKITRVSEKFKDWFLDYASYVILERAVPALEDGLKPVQRRILHAMKEMDDGRYNKVANIIGQTMQYHPHGDASIYDAIVALGQKDLLIDTQGNWGNILTGDGAAAARYIEARLSKFALEVMFSPKITQWALSYDGRKKEPVFLPAKFPILLAQGAEGIAVGLSTTILPHNFNELIDASVKILQGKKVQIYPDFPTGGMVDVSKYNDGKKGGKITVRAKIEIEDNKTLVIREIPFKTTTGTLIDSIIKANENGKIKIKKILDNTAENVEIRILLPPGVSPDKTIDALYAFTKCEVSVSPQAVVVYENKPRFMGVSEILEHSAKRTVELLRQELQIQLNELQEKWHAANLERIFIEKRIYLDIQEEETWEGVLRAIDQGLKPHIKHLKRPVTRDDLIRLTEIKIKRISKYDLNKAKKNIEDIEAWIEETEFHLANIIDYTINFFKNIKKKYGKGRERKTEIRSFENIEATKVVVRNVKLYVNREEGFVGTSMRKDEYVADVSDIDDLIIFRRDGKFLVTKVAPKTFVGKDIIHVGVFKKKDERTVYNMIYRDGKKGPYYMKRFHVKSITRNKEYDLTQGKEGSKVMWFTANPNGEAETVTVYLRPTGKSRKTKFDIDFSELLIKSRTARGNLVTKLPVKSIKLKEKGVSTLQARKLWFDPIVKRLNTEERGQYLGEFRGDDKMFYVTSEGEIEVFIPVLEKHFPDKLELIAKLEPQRPLTVVYYDPAEKRHYLKRLYPGEIRKKDSLIPEGTRLSAVSYDWRPVLQVTFRKKDKKPLTVNAEDFIAVKGYKAKGKILAKDSVLRMKFLEPLPYEPPAVEVEPVENQEENQGNISGKSNGNISGDQETIPEIDIENPGKKSNDDDKKGPTELTLF